MSEQADKQSYIDDMAMTRGYVLDFHKTLTQNDFAVMKRFNELVEEAYLVGRRLPRGTKELVYIAILTTMRAPKSHIASHVRAALKHGASKQEILEALEIVLLSAGVVPFQEGLEAWKQETGAGTIEPREVGSSADPRSDE